MRKPSIRKLKPLRVVKKNKTPRKLNPVREEPKAENFYDTVTNMRRF